jgi:hypothetical protein
MFGRLPRAATLSLAEWRLLSRAYALVVMIRLGLWFRHPSDVLRRVEDSVKRSSGKATTGGRASVSEIAWAIRAASRRVPQASCLVQALAGRVLLSAHGHESTLQIGVARGEALEAHAWVVVDGIRIIGGRGSDRYSPLPDIAQALPDRPRRSTRGDES